ncbi:MAG: ABC transporter permease [Anaerolineae bacterium]|nr:ABC transporter permease [Anaerolineae bacterium]MDW8171140.1 ABC transporter permease [Anaerolineae bacterium]
MYRTLNPRQQFSALLLALVKRDLTARYRRSFLGPLWAILQPLLLMLLFLFLSSVVNIPSEGAPYVLFSFAALVPWTFFNNAINGCAPSITTNAGLLKKMAVPREVFPLGAVTIASFDLLMAGSVLAFMLLVFNVPLTFHLAWLPVLALGLGLLALGVGMFIAALATYRRDFVYATPFLLQFWLYATPVAYPLSSVPERFMGLYQLNPTVGYIDGFRSVIVHGRAPDFSLLLLAFGISALVFLVGWGVFRLTSQYFADVL